MKREMLKNLITKKQHVDDKEEVKTCKGNEKVVKNDSKIIENEEVEKDSEQK